MTNKRISLAPDLEFSRIVHGYWRLTDWNLSTLETEALLTQGIDFGVTTIDHADIYGDYEVEALFGKVLKGNSALRDKLELVSKCGIMLKSNKFPDRAIKHYDYSASHIIQSVNNSLRYLNTDYLDVLLLHRPSPFYKPAEVSAAFEQLQKQGKVRYFGVSNFTPQQFRTLQSYCDLPLVTNQVEISVNCLEHFDNHNIDFFLERQIHPMAWSPLGGGSLFSPQMADSPVVRAVKKVADQTGTKDFSQIMYAWLLNHPVGILPIVGSSNILRLKSAVEALEIKMTTEQWFSIYQATLGQEVP